MIEQPKKIGILSYVGTEPSGNGVTATRIRSFLHEAGLDTSVFDTSQREREPREEGTGRTFQTVVKENELGGVFAINVFDSRAVAVLQTSWARDITRRMAIGEMSAEQRVRYREHYPYGYQRLARTTLPYAVVPIGSDMDLDYAKPGYRRAIDAVIRGAEQIITYQERFKDLLQREHPDKAIRHVVKSVDVCPDPNFSLRSRAGLALGARYLLLPTGIRDQKDPLYLVDDFIRWRNEKRYFDVFLVIVGGARSDEEAFGRNFERKIARSQNDGVIYISSLNQAELHRAMVDAVAVLNSSKVESDCRSLLEAMRLGALVVARDNEGNRDLITRSKDGGYLFRDPKECFAFIDGILESPLRADQMARVGFEYADTTRGSRCRDEEAGVFVEAARAMLGSVLEQSAS